MLDVMLVSVLYGSGNLYTLGHAHELNASVTVLNRESHYP